MIMGIYIGIKKCKEQDNVHYYFVDPDKVMKPDFYIGINPTSNKTLFYWDTTFSNSFGEIDFNDLHKKVIINEIDPKVLHVVVIRSLKALRENNFPDSMSYCA